MNLPMLVENASITVLKELKEFILPLSKEEFSLLEQNIISDGCRDPLVVWKALDGKNILIDGHNRLKICQKNNLPYKVKKVHFADIQEVKIWMLDNQMGRRNLNSDQLSYYRGLKYFSIKQVKGGYKNILSKGQNELSTSEALAAQFKVSESTIKRDAKFAEGLDIIGRSNPLLRAQILAGKAKVKKADIQILTEHENASKLTFKNEADIYNKAKRIRDEILDDVERKIVNIQNKRIRDARAVLAEKEPVFLKREDRFRKIKGMIISSINKAINERNVDAMKELKKLVDKLEYELLSKGQ